MEGLYFLSPSPSWSSSSSPFSVSSLLLLLLLLLLTDHTTVLARLNPDHFPRLRSRTERPVVEPTDSAEEERYSRTQKRPAARFLTNLTEDYWVDPVGVPDVDFDVGESYAGLIPFGRDEDDEDDEDDKELFFWFFPRNIDDVDDSDQGEIVIWLNGGPGCSSMEGLIKENGPFLWQSGTPAPVRNPWSWNRLAHMVYVDQPFGVGLSHDRSPAAGRPERLVSTEDDVAADFLAFWRRFVDLFQLHGRPVYLTGESYAGMYCSYTGMHMLNARDTAYADLRGMLLYDPVLADDAVQADVPALAFTDYWRGLHPFNDSFVAHARNLSDACGFSAYLDRYLVYPAPADGQPAPRDYPWTDAEDLDDRPMPECAALFGDLVEAATALNPCWNIYHVATTCPLPWDVVGFPGSFQYSPPGAGPLYFDREDVRRAVHARSDFRWAECGASPFRDNVDASLPPILYALPSVVERTNNVIIAHGALDFVLVANGTLLAIQNMTWHGHRGFRTAPRGPLFVPYHDEAAWFRARRDVDTRAGAGVFGTAHTERGLTYAAVDISGHMGPQYAPSAAFRLLEVLLDKVPSLHATIPFTIARDWPQPDRAAVGFGTAPQGWSSGRRADSDHAGVRK